MTQDALSKAHAALDEIAQAMVPPELKAAGWRYVDFPTRFSYEMWDYLLRLIGEGEYKLLAMTVAEDSKGAIQARGQFLISPQGQKNLLDKSRREAN